MSLVVVQFDAVHHTDDVVALIAGVQALHSRREPKLYPPVSRDDVEAWLPTSLEGGSRLLVAARDSDVVGYILFRVDRREATTFTYPAAVAYVAQLGVRSDEQRRGVGRRLLDAVLAEARDAGVSQVELDTRAWNEAAAGLFTSVGFRRSRSRFVADIG